MCTYTEPLHNTQSLGKCHRQEVLSPVNVSLQIRSYIVNVGCTLIKLWGEVVGGKFPWWQNDAYHKPFTEEQTSGF